MRSSGASIPGQVIILLGCLLLVVGPFLTWMAADMFSVSVSGLEKTGNEALILVGLGVIGIVVAIISLAQKRDAAKWTAFAVGLVGLGFSVYYFFALRDQISENDSGLFDLSLGAGIYLCLAGAVVALIGATVVAAHRRR
jgi:hypothetical protein